MLDFPKNAQMHTCEWHPARVTNVRSYQPYPELHEEAGSAAAELINHIKPKVAIPIHYGSVAGKPEDADVFRQSIDASVAVEVKLKF